MFKKLFGKKKETKPASLAEAEIVLLENIGEESLNKQVAVSFQHCVEHLESSSKEEIEGFKKNVFNLAETLSLPQSGIAFSVFCGLLERGHATPEDIQKSIDLYKSHLAKSLPFYQLIDKKVKKGEEGDQESDLDVDSLYHDLIRDREQIPQEVAVSVGVVEQLAQSFINILSLDQSYIEMGKTALKDDVVVAIDYNQGCYWLARLFHLLFDQAIVVIDVDNHVGFEGKMTGVSDNYQMQHLLMGLTELNEHPAINKEALAVANGTGVHASNFMIDSKWNMYNLDIINEEGWQEIKIGPAKTHELRDLWIWGEGTPKEIAVHNGRRAILLGRSSYKRTTRVQRTFKNVKAGIEVEKVLSPDEIDVWLGLSNDEL